MTNYRQSGIVAIMVTMIMMIVIALIVLGFAEISRTEQFSALNNQLSTAAYYAAESGINQARADIENQLANQTTSTPIVASKPNCNSSGANGEYNNLDYVDSGGRQTQVTTLSAGENIRYTCVIINAAPTSLFYNISYSPTVVPIITGSRPFGVLELNWRLQPSSPQNYNPNSCPFPQSPTLPPESSPESSWSCPYPMLQVDILNANNGLARQSWQNDTSVMFFYPSSSASSPTVLSYPGGLIHPAQCNAHSCQADISGFTGTNYYMKVNTIYGGNALLTITSPPNGQFADAQATIDSTGQAQDALRRVLVYVDLTNANYYPVPSGGLITENNICKQFEVYAGALTNPNGCSP